MKHWKRAKHRVPPTTLLKHVKQGNFAMILYRIAKNLLWRGHDKDLVQLILLQTIEQEGETL